MNTQNNDRCPPKQKWIGLAHVRPRPGNEQLGGAIGAFVGAVALAADTGSYAQAITGVLEEYDFEVIEIKDVETVGPRKKSKHSVSNVRLAKAVDVENPVALGTFHAYMP